jgi:hypothetical protein
LQQPLRAPWHGAVRAADCSRVWYTVTVTATTTDAAAATARQLLTVPGRRRGPRSEMYLRRRASRRPLRGPARRPRRGCAWRPRPSNVAMVPMMSGMSAALTARMTSDARPASKKGTASPVARTLAAGPIPNHSAEYRGEHRERRRNGDGDKRSQRAGKRSEHRLHEHARTNTKALPASAMTAG